MSVDFFKNEVAKVVSKALSKKVDVSSIEIPPGSDMGDYTFPCFSLSKKLKKNPGEISVIIKEKIKSSKYFDYIKVVGPYINFFVDRKELSERVLVDVFHKKMKYGSGKGKKNILLEGWQPNTHKAFHIGHIRNSVLPESISRVLEFYGYKVVRAAYMGDVGAHVAKWLWYFSKFYKGNIPKENVSKWAGEIYTKATKKSIDIEKYIEEINDIHKRLEEGDKKLVSIWKKTRNLCLKDFSDIYSELGSKLDRYYFESEVEKSGKEIVEKFVKKGIFEESEGAIIINLEKYSLGVFVLLKSNGASLYSTKDIALAYLKSKNYNFDLSIYVVANEQEHHFSQLFKTLELIKYKDSKKLVHINYGMVTLKEGKMSSREGNFILYEDFRDKLFKNVEKLVKDRDLSEKKKKEIVKDVSFGAMKFTMLNQDSHRNITFDFDKALNFDGETGPYIQYTHARACSLLEKYGKKVVSSVDFSLLKKEEEKKLVKLLYEFPMVVERSALEYKPNLVCRNLLDLSQAFNEYYHKYKILDSSELEKVRVLLVYCVKNVICVGLGLLGIEAVEEM